MKVTLDKFRAKISALDQSIRQYYVERENEETKLISDGVVDAEEYFNASPKILWILKEPYDEGDGTGGGWSLTEFINSKDFYSRIGKSKNTWNPIIYIVYSIFNGYIYWEDMDYIKNNINMVAALKKIAFINVQKLAAFSRTPNDNKIAGSYYQSKHLLLSQIKTYDPDIVIGGGTLKLFLNDLGLTENEKDYEEFDFWVKNGKLFIDAYHPGFRPTTKGISKEEYVDDVVTIVKDAYYKGAGTEVQ